MDHWWLSEKVVLITGGASGDWSGHGARPGAKGRTSGVSRSDSEALARTAAAITPAPLTIELDVTDAAACAAAVERVVAEHGRLDVVWANVGRSCGLDTDSQGQPGWRLPHSPRSASRRHRAAGLRGRHRVAGLVHARPTHVGLLRDGARGVRIPRGLPRPGHRRGRGPVRGDRVLGRAPLRRQLNREPARYARASTRPAPRSRPPAGRLSRLPVAFPSSRRQHLRIRSRLWRET